MLSRIVRAWFSTAEKSHIVQSRTLKDKLLNTLTSINKASSVTLGPMGRLVAIENELGAPRVTKDGVTVVKHIEFQQRLDNAIATLVKRAVSNANKFSGDGTTTTTLLTYNLVKAALSLSMFDVNQVKVRKGMNIAKDIAIQLLGQLARPVEKESDLLKVALIATNNDARLSDLISEALSRASDVKVEKTTDLRGQSYLEYYQGTKITRGIPHQMLVNKQNKIQFNYPIVLVSAIKLDSVDQIVNVLEKARKMKKQLLIFAPDISEGVSSMLYYNHSKKILECCPIRLPGVGNYPRQLIKKIGSISKAYIFGAQHNTKRIQDVDFEDFGTCIKVVVDQFETNILSKSNEAENNCIIKVSGNTESETLEVYDKAVDGLNSVRTARQKGVVPGGGICYLRCAQAISLYRDEDPDVDIGVRCVERALREPQRHLMRLSEMEYVEPTTGWQGYDFKRMEKVADLFESGIIDSVRVAQNCILDSVSLASMLTSLQLAIVKDLRYKQTKLEAYKNAHQM